jgi:hypothetical protein
LPLLQKRFAVTELYYMKEFLNFLSNELREFRLQSEKEESERIIERQKREEEQKKHREEMDRMRNESLKILNEMESRLFH